MIDDLDRRPGRRRETRRAGQIALAVAIAGSALAVGSVHTITLCIVTAVLALAVVLEWWTAEPMNVRSAATALLLTGCVLTAYTALQCVPLPAGWLSAIAPYNANVWSRALAPLGESGPRYAPLSLDPTATRVEILKGVAYVLAFVAGLRVARSREGVGTLSAIVTLTGVVLAITALLHPAFGAHRLFGMYEPHPGAGDRHLAPLLNPNNLAGYVNVALCLALAETLAPEPRMARPIMGSISLFLIVTELWIASRGGVLTMVIGAFVVVLITYVAHSRREGALTTLSIGTGVAAVSGAALLVVFGSDEASNELMEGGSDKLGFFWQALRMSPAMPFFGCGRGAFESAFPAFRTGVGHATFTHAENVVAQWIVEWGLPLALAALATVAVALRPRAVLARSKTATGAWAALVAFALQSLVDLGSEVPGLMLAFVICAAIVVAGTRGRETRWRLERWARAPRVVAVAAVASAIPAIALASSGVHSELATERERLHDAALVHTVPRGEMHALERAAMSRHPAEPYLPFVGGLRAAHAGDESPLPWLGASLERARVYAPAHMVLARVLASRSPSQARLEYRMTLEQAPELLGYVLSEAPRLVGGFYDATELAPAGPKGVPMLDGLATAVEDRLPAARVRIDAELLARAPNNPDAIVRIARDACEDVEAGEAAPWCVGPHLEGCVRDALAKSSRVQQLLPDQCIGYELHARVRAMNGDHQGALGEIERAADDVSDRTNCLQKFVGLARGLGYEERAQAALDRLVNSGCTTDAECAASLNWVALQHESAGNLVKALSLAKRAHERTPENDALTEHVASLAARVGLHGEAADDYELLSRRNPGNPRWRKAAEAERREVVKSALRY